MGRRIRQPLNVVKVGFDEFEKSFSRAIMHRLSTVGAAQFYAEKKVVVRRAAVANEQRLLLTAPRSSLASRSELRGLLMGNTYPGAHHLDRRDGLLR